MVTIKTKQPLLTLKGEVITNTDKTEIPIGDIICNILSGNVTENPARAYQLAKKFANDETVELKAEDVVYLKKQVESNKNLSALFAGQILELLDK